MGCAMSGRRHGFQAAPPCLGARRSPFAFVVAALPTFPNCVLALDLDTWFAGQEFPNLVARMRIWARDYEKRDS